MTEEEELLEMARELEAPEEEVQEVSAFEDEVPEDASAQEDEAAYVDDAEGTEVSGDEAQQGEAEEGEEPEHRARDEPEREQGIDRLEKQVREACKTQDGAKLVKRALADETAKKMIDGGEWDVKEAMAYVRGKEENAPAKKHTPSTLRARATREETRVNTIKNMSDEAFEKFSRRVQRMTEEGKRVRLD